MTKENLENIDHLVAEEVNFSSSHILALLRKKQRIGVLNGLEIGKNAPACLAGILQGFAEAIIDDVIACTIESESNSVEMRHLQVVILSDQAIREFVYHE